MGNKYNEQDISWFFENFRNLKDIYDLDKVHHLINNPDAKATQKVKFKYKPLKIIIMTSLLMILVSAVLFWPDVEKVDNNKQLVENVTNNKSYNEDRSEQIESNANKHDNTLIIGEKTEKKY